MDKCYRVVGFIIYRFGWWVNRLIVNQKPEIWMI